MKIRTLPLCAALLASTALMSPATLFAQDASGQDAAAQDVPAPEAVAPAAEEPTVVTIRGRNVPNTMRRTAEVSSILTAEDMRRSGDDTAAVALTRVTGLSLVEGRFIYVRGLGERYSSALLNGSPLPSPEPLQRVVPLDLFPSSILSRVSVQKTHSADYWAEFGGGLIDLRTLTTPRAPFFNFGFGTGGNTETTFKDGFTHYGSDTDIVGFDDGTRDVPDLVKQANRNGQRITASNFTDAQLTAMGQSFTNAPLNLIQQTDSLPANFSFNAAGGTVYDAMGGRIGVSGVLDFSNSWRARNGVQQTSLIDLDELTVYDDYEYSSTENNVSLNGLVSLGYEGERNSIQWTSLYVRNTTKRTKVREGYDGGNGEIRRRDETGWYARELAFTQLVGRNAFGNGWTLDWRGSWAETSRDAPYEKSIEYAQNAQGYWYHDASRVQNRMGFSELNDTSGSAGVALTREFMLGEGRDGKVTGGFETLRHERDSESRLYSFKAGNQPLPTDVQYTRVDFLLADYNIRPDRLMLVETTGADGAAAYEARLDVDAAYLKADIAVMPLVRVAGGLRFEAATQSVAVVNLFANEAAAAPIAPRETDYLLPSFTTTWNFAEDMQLRFGASQTIGRPQFRELAPQVYLDPEQDRLFVGNPYLVDTEILNLDARWEYYYDAGQFVTAGLFYKDLDKPVEAIILDTGSGEGQQSYINAPRAVLYGVEFDYKGLFDSPFEGQWFATKQWLVQANYTYTSSEVKVGAGDVVYTLANGGMPTPATNYIADGTRMQGQSEHMANIQFGWDDREHDSQATMLITYVSERTSARGKPGYPDYMQKPGVTVDLTWRRGITAFDRDLMLTLEARNLTGTRYEEYQSRNGRVDINSYDLGTSVSIGLSTQF